MQIRIENELNAVIESISYGKTFHYKKLTFQAFSAAISSPEHVKFVFDYLGNVNNTLHTRFPSSKNKVVAYRVNQTQFGGMTQMNSTTATVNQLVKKDADQKLPERILNEGFDDDGEAGAGEKLLGMLQKMEVENIIVIVCIWTSGVGSLQIRGGELYKIILDRAKELLTTIHEQIVA